VAILFCLSLRAAPQAVVPMKFVLAVVLNSVSLMTIWASRMKVGERSGSPQDTSGAAQEEDHLLVGVVSGN